MFLVWMGLSLTDLYQTMREELPQIFSEEAQMGFETFSEEAQMGFVTFSEEAQMGFETFSVHPCFPVELITSLPLGLIYEL